jgi:fructokinase
MRIGIDLGGSKIEGIVLDAGEERARLRVPAPRGDYGRTLDAIARLVEELERLAGSRGTIGIGIPGVVSPTTGLVKNANSVWLNGKPLLDDLRSRLGRDVRTSNDANCFTMSEAVDGAAAGADVVFGVVVGTGTGGGIVVRGRVLTGANAVAGEWGHNPLPWPTEGELPGPACYCGRNGCIETFLSGPGMAADHHRRTGQSYDPEDILRRATAGDNDAEATVRRYESRMGRALASIINVLDPDVIVLGGGLSNIERLYDHVPQLWADRVFGAGVAPGEAVRTRLVRARHGDSSGVRGAAWLWGDQIVGSRQ